MHSLLKPLACCIDIRHSQADVSKAFGLRVSIVISLESLIALCAPVMCELKHSRPAEHPPSLQQQQKAKGSNIMLIIVVKTRAIAAGQITGTVIPKFAAGREAS